MKFKRILAGIFIGLLAFAVGLSVVGIYRFAADTLERAYPVPSENVLDVVDDNPPHQDTKPPVMDYQPLHWPRLENTRLAFPGKWQTDEAINTRGSETWFGLYKTRNGYEVREAELLVADFKKRGWTESYESYELDMKKIWTNTREQPLFMFQGIPGIKQGKAYSSHYFLKESREENLANYEVCKGYSIPIAGKEYHLTADGAESYGDECFGGKAVLTNGVTRQILSDPSIEGENGRIFDYNQVVWVGDLDADGRPDLILNYTYQPCMALHNYYVLYLSSHAADGELAAPVAKFESTN